MSHAAQFLSEAKQVIDGLNIDAIERMATHSGPNARAEAVGCSSSVSVAARPTPRTPSTIFVRSPESRLTHQRTTFRN